MPAVHLSRRRLLAMAGVACMGTLIAPPRSESQIPPLLLDIGLDLGKKLFDMGIEYAKGTVLETVFKQPTISDVHQWVDRSVTSIEAKIAALDAKIDRLNLDKMASDLQSVKNEFEHYARMPLNQKQQNRDAYWDGGLPKIKEFLNQHKQDCQQNEVCNALRLRTVTVDDCSTGTPTLNTSDIQHKNKRRINYLIN